MTLYLLEPLKVTVDGCVLKQVQRPPKGEREVVFYETVFDKKEEREEILQLRRFLPVYYGIVELGILSMYCGCGGFGVPSPFLSTSFPGSPFFLSTSFPGSPSFLSTQFLGPPSFLSISLYSQGVSFQRSLVPLQYLDLFLLSTLESPFFLPFNLISHGFFTLIPVKHNILNNCMLIGQAKSYFPFHKLRPISYYFNSCDIKLFKKVEPTNFQVKAKENNLLMSLFGIIFFNDITNR